MSAPADRPLRPPPEETTSVLAPVGIEAPRLFALLDPEGGALVDDPFEAAGITPERLLAVHRSMLLLQALDDRMMKHQRQGRIGFYGAANGQEAVPVVTAEALEARDWIFPALREGASMLHRGFPLTTYLSQIFGNGGDVLKGRNMPSHMADRGVNQVSWGSVIGTQISQAVGAAWAARYRGDDVVVAAFMGDGATSSNDFHAGLNFAAVWKAPVVFVCQNNQWSISVPTTAQTGSETIAQKAVAYGMRGYRVDGNDALALHRVLRETATAARRGEGPALIECLTYRMGAHSSSDDPRVYRDDREVEAWARRNPVDRLSAFLRGSGHLDEAGEEAMKVEVAAEVAAAVAEAEALGPPPREALFEDVFEAPDWRLREQAAELALLPEE
ncbi:MAG: thiamine pyrophosphate-dependent enzyme [Deltaproteobacteria bacterium]|nr:thiamine pyrophosphate-dependent enzyme [Deltaproteobacteria bacterium]